MSEKLRALADAAFQGCTTNVGPLIGAELTIAEVSLDPGTALPDTTLALLPLSGEVDDERIAELLIASPLDEIATLARRMLDDTEPDKVREISSDERDAVGEVLNLISGAVDAAVRASLGESVHARPMRWWRSDEPEGNSIPEGDFAIARCTLQIASAGTVGLWLRVPSRLLEDGAARSSKRQVSRVLLLGVEPELQSELEPLFARAQVKVEARAPDDSGLEEILKVPQTLVLSGERSESLALCRKLRSGNQTWRLPVVMCMRNPTRTRVIEAVDSGAVQVLAIPTDEISLLRILQQAKASG